MRLLDAWVHAVCVDILGPSAGALVLSSSLSDEEADAILDVLVD
jgi:hypothetical protein